MKISVTPVSFSKMFVSGKMDIDSFIDCCSGLGVDAVDILDTVCYPWFWRGRETLDLNLKRRLEDSGLKLAAYATGNNFALSSDAEFGCNVDKVKNALREAAELGAPLLRIFGGAHEGSGGEKGMSTHKGLVRVAEGIEQCLPEAEKCNVVLALENHGRLPGHSYEVEALIKRFNSPYLKCVFDCANFMGNNMDEPEDPLRAYERLRQYVIHVHVKDNGPSIVNDRKAHGYVLGKGNVPLRQFVNLLEDDSYSGYCSLEYEASRMMPEEYGVAESIEYLKEIRDTQKYIRKLLEGKN